MKRASIVSLLAGALLLAACSANAAPQTGAAVNPSLDTALSAPALSSDAISALEARVAVLEEASAQSGELAARLSALETAVGSATSGDSTNLEARLVALEEKASASGEAAHGGEQHFQVTVAAWQMDTAGFHGMDVTLNEDGGEINPQWISSVRRVSNLIAVTDWPESLHEQAVAFRESLIAFATALEADDLEAAKPLAEQIHHEGHELSHEVEHWLGEQGLAGEGH